MRNLRAQSFGGDVIAENDPDECGFHADSDTHSTHIRTVIPR
ncbi:hypothetical protein [Aquipseudomonas alcaligenes]|nr:hypothetical protein [Pseudomonas alcaligenes]